MTFICRIITVVILALPISLPKGGFFFDEARGAAPEPREGCNRYESPFPDGEDPAEMISMVRDEDGNKTKTRRLLIHVNSIMCSASVFIRRLHCITTSFRRQFELSLVLSFYRSQL